MGKRRRGFRGPGVTVFKPEASTSSTPQTLHHHTNYFSRGDRVSARKSVLTANSALQDTPSTQQALNSGILNDGHQALADSSFSDTFESLEPQYFTDLAAGEFVEENKASRNRNAGDNPLLEWVPEIDTYLVELIRHEGRCGFTDGICPLCQQPGAIYRCRDCEDIRLFCKSCVLVTHKRLFLHRMMVWDENHFQRVTLKSLRLRVQLGHPSGDLCVRPIKAPRDDFVLLDTHAIHELGLDFCGCDQQQPHVTQLLRASMMPATSTDPKTAGTFRLLEHLHLLSAQSKVSGYEFYMTLARLTDNTGIHPLKDRYPSLMRLIRQWRHLKLLKRAGRGHSSSGVEGTSLGECAVMCPACPHPGKNIPDDWRDAPPDRRWLYRQFVGIDANFRLKRKKVSSDAVDPGLNKGYAYFVEEAAYKEFLKKFDSVAINEQTTCNEHDAIKLANFKGAQGTAASGVGTIECSRHDMKRPCSVGDLQKGERYVNMDYLFFSSMAQNSTDDLVVSYDIACQWSKNLWLRLERYPQTFDFERSATTFLIPKFHLPAHQENCQTTYSFNLTVHVGRTDGEAVERGWAFVNPFASSTKEMGPGSRRDLLDDVFGDYNWRKVTQLGRTLSKKLKNAINQRDEQMAAFEAFDATLPPESTSLWKAQIEAWEADPTKTNPFVVTRSRVTMNGVRLELAREDAAALRNHSDEVIHDTVSASAMIVMGLDLEEQQRRLKSDFRALGQHATELQHAKIIERRNVLQRKIEAWQNIQHLYMPAVGGLRARLSTADAYADEVHSENIPLLLPSSTMKAKVTCDQKLMQQEYSLREAQAHDALEGLRRHLRLRTSLYHFKDRFVTGQHYNTRARSTIDGVQMKVNADAIRYRMARAALVVLGPKLGKEMPADLNKLEPDDVRGMTDPLPRQSEGTRTFSWIWKILGAACDSGTNEDTDEDIRIEWCKSRARAHRWTEECTLLLEEMRRVLAFYEWSMNYWKDYAIKASDRGEGHTGYANRQVSIRRSMRDVCIRMWSHVLGLSSS